MKDKGEKGSFTVEAILSLSIFMFAFVTIVSLATVAKIESTTQYAIDQTAKEISKYTYIASRANLLVHPKDSAEATVDSIDEAVQSMYDFSDVLSSSTGGNGVTLNSEGLSDMLSGMSGDDFKSITASAQNVYNSFAPLMSDPKGAITALAQVVAQKGGSALVSRVIAQPLCKALLPKYITQQDDASAVLEKMGVVNGLDGLDFSLSTFLMDQRTINVVLVYEIDVKGFGIFDQKLIVKQTASTAAWLADTEGVKLSDVASKTSAWQKSDMERGKDYISELQYSGCPTSRNSFQIFAPSGRKPPARGMCAMWASGQATAMPTAFGRRPWPSMRPRNMERVPPTDGLQPAGHGNAGKEPLDDETFTKICLPQYGGAVLR